MLVGALSHFFKMYEWFLVWRNDGIILYAWNHRVFQWLEKACLWGFSTPLVDSQRVIKHFFRLSHEIIYRAPSLYRPPTNGLICDRVCESVLYVSKCVVVSEKRYQRAEWYNIHHSMVGAPLNYLDVDEVFGLVDGLDPGSHDWVLQRNSCWPLRHWPQHLKHTAQYTVWAFVA